MISSLELTGYLAGIIMVVALMPQIIKSWKTKSTKDISIGWNSIYIFGLILWIVYGIGIKSYPLTFTVIVETILAISLLILKFRYG